MSSFSTTPTPPTPSTKKPLAEDVECIRAMRDLLSLKVRLPTEGGRLVEAMTDERLLRFLRARKFDVDAATDQYARYMDYRVSKFGKRPLRKHAGCDPLSVVWVHTAQKKGGSFLLEENELEDDNALTKKNGAVLPGGRDVGARSFVGFGEAGFGGGESVGLRRVARDRIHMVYRGRGPGVADRAAGGLSRRGGRAGRAAETARAAAAFEGVGGERRRSRSRASRLHQSRRRAAMALVELVRSGAGPQIKAGRKGHDRFHGRRQKIHAPSHRRALSDDVVVRLSEEEGHSAV
mmetsp:Transcript_29230/g.89413  ORF Transcript_29230/g.89413 Transcript_29230/m.89413 type:complete len:292 (-) Transcript_29230:1690-2565(-)